VQHTHQDAQTNEALNYEYTIDRGIPQTPSECVEFGAEHFSFWRDHQKKMEEWLVAEEYARRYPDDESSTLSMYIPTEDLHPELKKMREGGAYAYSYNERMIGLRATVRRTLTEAETSRRMFWPIFHPMDAIRSNLMTRIPCTLGAEFLVRQIPGDDYTVSKAVNMTLIQRSVDFSRFWLSDVYLWHRTQAMVAKDLNLPVGQFAHFIVSFHRFDDGLETFS